MTNDERVLVLMPTAKDGERTRQLVREAGLECALCKDVVVLCQEIERGAGAALLTEEAVAGDRDGCLLEILKTQPPWSDFPLVVLARQGSEGQTHEIRESMNATLVEHPLKIRSLLSVLRSALRTRRRQYEVRDYLIERERAEQDLARLAAIVESSEDAIVSKDLDGVILSWNAGAERLFGYGPDEAVGRSITLIIPPELFDEERSILERLRRGERIEHFETVRMAKDGRRMDISLTISPVRNREGKVIGASKVARDVTGRKRAETALWESQARLKESEERYRAVAEERLRLVQELRDADRKKDEFIALLAHELRNPLAPIRNGLQVMRLANGDARALTGTREMMDRQLTHMVRLIDDLLDVSRIRRNKMELRCERVLLADIVNSAVEAAHPLIDAAGHELTVSLPATPVYLNADLTRLAQVFGNLLSNSAKYTPRAGHIRLSARREQGEVVVSVKDNGIGIPAACLDNIFDMFSQVDRSVERSTGGLGIGLALVKGLVEMHGGSVKAESEGENKGSTFTVTLQALPDRVEGGPGPTNGRAVHGPARRVLVADDNRDGGESLALMLRLMGNEVRIATDGVDAVAQAERFRPEVILMDVGMPRLNGLDATREIRQQPWGKHMTIIALTGWGQENDRERSREAGCDAHLIKPVNLPELEKILAETLSRILE